MGTATTNLRLQKPAQSAAGWHDTINANLDTIDAALAGAQADIADSPEVHILTGTFNGPTGRAVTLPKAVSAITEYGAIPIPYSRAGSIGDVWAVKGTSSVTVYCSASNTSDTFYLIIWYKGELNAYGVSQFREWIVSPDAAIIDHGDATEEGSLAWVCAQVESDQVDVLLPGTCTYQLRRNATVPEGVRLKAARGAVVKCDVSIRSAAHEWIASAHGTSEYYCRDAVTHGNPGIVMPHGIAENGAALARGSAGSLVAGEWDQTDNDGLGYSAPYVRLSDSTDPDTKAAAYVEAVYKLTISGQFLGSTGQHFDHATFTTGTPAVVFANGLTERLHPDWWGDDDNAMQNAITTAVDSSVPLVLLGHDYPVTAGLYGPGSFDIHGQGKDRSKIVYTGPDTMVTFTAKTYRLSWRDFQVDTTGSAQNGVHVFDFDYGTERSMFIDVEVNGTANGGTAVIDTAWLVRGQPAAGGAGSNQQYDNTWINCGVGRYALCAWKMGTDISNGRANGNHWIGCETGISVSSPWHIIGNCNTWTGGNLNQQDVGTYSMIFEGDSTYKNVLTAVYFDGTPKPVKCMSNTTNNSRPMAEFLYCLGIKYSVTAAHNITYSNVWDYEDDGTTPVYAGATGGDTDGMRIRIEDDRQHFHLNTFATGYNIDFATAGNLNIRRGGLLVTDGHMRCAGGYEGIGAAEEVTIATGVVTITQSHVKILTEGAASSDDLDTINATGISVGDKITLRASDSTKTVVLKNGTGNMYIGADLTLDNARDTVVLFYRTTNEFVLWGGFGNNAA